MGSHYSSIRAIQIYMKEETKKSLSFKFQQNRSMRTLPPMRTFINLASEEMSDLRWLICCARKDLRAVAERVSQMKKQIAHKTS